MENFINGKIHNPHMKHPQETMSHCVKYFKERRLLKNSKQKTLSAQKINNLIK